MDKINGYLPETFHVCHVACRSYLLGYYSNQFAISSHSLSLWSAGVCHVLRQRLCINAYSCVDIDILIPRIFDSKRKSVYKIHIIVIAPSITVSLYSRANSRQTTPPTPPGHKSDPPPLCRLHGDPEFTPPRSKA